MSFFCHTIVFSSVSASSSLLNILNGSQRLNDLNGTAPMKTSKAAETSRTIGTAGFSKESRARVHEHEHVPPSDTLNFYTLNIEPA
jgi:hypothetical protein